MIVLGVDPGTMLTGWGVVDLVPGRPALHVDHGTIRTKASSPLWERLGEIHAGIAAVAARHRPDALALEQCFVSKNVQSALKLGHTRGVIMIACLATGTAVHEYAPSQIKSAVTGNGRASKDQVAEMVRVILRLPKPPQSDAADALAAAICHSNGVGMRRAFAHGAR